MDSSDDEIIRISEWPVTPTEPSQLRTGCDESDTKLSPLITRQLGSCRHHVRRNDDKSHDKTLYPSEKCEPHIKKFRTNFSGSFVPASKSPNSQKEIMSEVISQHCELSKFKLDDKVGLSSQLHTENHTQPHTQEVEPLVHIRLARWWRRHKHLLNLSLPDSRNPETQLYYISRTNDGRSFLLDEKRQLQRKSDQARADVIAAIASIDDWLGHFKAALRNISLAVDLEPNNPVYKFLQAKLHKQCKALDVQVQMKSVNVVPSSFPSYTEVVRVSAADLGVDDFFQKFVQRRQPVILLDLVNSMTKHTWTFDFIQSVAGSIKTVVKRMVPQSLEWAKLENSREITVGEFIDEVRGGQTRDYLFDWSLPLHCPDLAQDITVPAYFSGNLLQKTAPGSLYRDSWPSLFVAPPGVVSQLHVDAFASSFWMALFQGQKRWTFFDQDDLPLLYPCYIHSLDPVFSVDPTHPDFDQWPLLGMTKPRQCVLQAGELLFVPAGSPHFVENLSESLAVSSNHVDQFNYESVCEELRINGLQDPRAQDLLRQLQHPTFLDTVFKSSQSSQVKSEQDYIRL